MYCNRTTGYSQIIAIIISILLGGFGGDRFYLGYIGTGLIKLATVGGFGVWSVIDTLLIILSSLRPADGSNYL